MGNWRSYIKIIWMFRGVEGIVPTDNVSVWVLEAAVRLTLPPYPIRQICCCRDMPHALPLLLVSAHLMDPLNGR